MAPSSSNTIFNFLTRENPAVTAAEEGRGNSSSPHYFGPKKLQKWDEFNFALLKEIYEEKLWAEANQTGRSFGNQYISKHDLEIKHEKLTEFLVTKWNMPMVMAALEAVSDSLHPCIWVALVKPDSETTGNQQSDFKGAGSKHKPKSKPKNKKQRQFLPDASAISLCGPCKLRDVQSFYKTSERLPKEYKPSFKWSSAQVDRLTDAKGFWVASKKNRDAGLPIKQAYTYSVSNGCRYGFILTTQEVFIFRVRPLNGPGAGSIQPGSDMDKRRLTREMKKRGLMEWVAVPWDVHRASAEERFEKLTVNLALWFLHILAGNSHGLDWNYRRLRDEVLVQQPCPPMEEPTPHPASPVTDEDDVDTRPESSFLLTPSRKRPADEEVQDCPNYSFRMEPRLPTHDSKDPDYLQDRSDTERDDSDEEAEDMDDLFPDGVQLRKRNEPRSMRNIDTRSTMGRKRTKRVAATSE
ncbi:hypothetical protein S7711_11122 [Stachybotrys chartarum IBT 7711]|uniref:Uncharacterized protein n=1 Tax=Stachybotrys chartarum (strain CBS 109288 / IBT 7711) TaxID=1280523 RepID=A0A084BCE6_STACB|nr:hypothetical protein S7711_11122 [Stachybotrys chartarum IBT 7711]